MPEDHDTNTKQDSPNGATVYLEDPSEYRPEIKDMVLGKEQDNFRVFYKVSYI